MVDGFPDFFVPLELEALIVDWMVGWVVTVSKSDKSKLSPNSLMLVNARKFTTVKRCTCTLVERFW